MTVRQEILTHDEMVVRAKPLKSYESTQVIGIRNFLMGKPDKGMKFKDVEDFFLSCEKASKEKFSAYDSESSPRKFVKGNDPTPLGVKELVFEALKKWDSGVASFVTFWIGFLSKFTCVDYDLDLIYSVSTKKVLKELKKLAHSMYPEIDQDVAVGRLIGYGAVPKAVRLAYSQDKSQEFLKEREGKFYDEFFNSQTISFDSPQSSESAEEDEGNIDSIVESHSTPVSSRKSPGVEEEALDAADPNETKLSMLEDSLVAYDKSKRLRGQTITMIASVCMLRLLRQRDLDSNEALSLFDMETDGLELVSQGWHVLREVIVDQGTLPQEQDLASAFGIKSKSALSNALKGYAEFLRSDLFLQK